MTQDAHDHYRRRLLALRLEHRDLDEVVSRLSADPEIGRTTIAPYEKAPSATEDQIAWLSKLIPDLDA